MLIWKTEIVWYVKFSKLKKKLYNNLKCPYDKLLIEYTVRVEYLHNGRQSRSKISLESK